VNARSITKGVKAAKGLQIEGLDVLVYSRLYLKVETVFNIETN
jgi:hypothetical protein